MELGIIRKVDLDSEMQQSYLDYAMSVIVSRALPDARDGLKPVQRRILYAMYDMGLRADTAYKKSARIVGEVLGKYHPHGDMAVYEAMARMAQDFSLRYMLVDGQGNFGSVDGDPPAAMRYTEARLSKIAMEMLNQIDQNTVDFSGNFDQTLDEPTVLPSAIPNLLVNGATGIAVGMATNIPPHNLGEVVDALTFMLHDWEKLDDITIPDLMRFIKGPDFPTGGVILQEAGSEGLAGAYATGRGRVIVQARAHLEEMVRGRSRIIVTELPYQVNKAALIERIAELVREETLEGIADLRDESDRQGMRIVIELSKTADPEKILRGLYKHTPMQTTFGIIMLALVDNEPHLLSLKQALRVYLDHRQVVVRRRSEYELARARARAHILEGLLVALKNLDAVIDLIRNSPDAEQARLRLIKRFKLTEIQAQAILDLPLRRLAALERKKIEQEYKDIAARIKELESLLKSPKRMRQVVADELNQMKQAYGDARRTHIVNVKEGSSATMLLTTTDVTPAETVWVGVTPAGAIVRAPEEELETLLGTLPPLWLIRANTHHTLYLVSCEGKAAAIPVHAVPEASKTPAGLPVSKVSPLTDEEVIAGMFALPPKNGEAKDETILTVSRMGMVKKSAVSELPGPSAHAFALARVNEGDELVAVKVTDGKSEILLGTVQGMAIRFKEEEIRPMGLAAAGVGGIKLAADDEVVDAVMLTAARELCFVASDGKAKRIPLKDFPLQGRYGQGVQAWKLARGARLVGLENPAGKIKALAHFIGGSAVQFDLEKIPQRYRAGQGETVVRPPAGESLIAVGFIPGGEKPPAEKPPRLPGSDGSGPDRKPSPDGKTSGSPAKSRTATKKTDTAKPKPAARAPRVKKASAAAAAMGTARAGVKKAMVKETALKPAEKKPASARRKRANPADEQLSLGFDAPPVEKPGKKPAAKPAATPVQPAAVKPKPTLKREKKPLPAARPAKAGPPVPESKVKTKKVSGDKTPAPPEPETPQPARRKSTPREH